MMHKSALSDPMNDLYETTIGMIRESGMPINRIADSAGVGKRWLADVMSGRYSDPGVKKIQRLHDYLIRQKIDSSAGRKAAA